MVVMPGLYPLIRRRVAAEIQNYVGMSPEQYTHRVKYSVNTRACRFVREAAPDRSFKR